LSNIGHRDSKKSTRGTFSGGGASVFGRAPNWKGTSGEQARVGVNSGKVKIVRKRENETKSTRVGKRGHFKVRRMGGGGRTPGNPRGRKGGGQKGSPPRETEDKEVSGKGLSRSGPRENQGTKKERIPKCKGSTKIRKPKQKRRGRTGGDSPKGKPLRNFKVGGG